MLRRWREPGGNAKGGPIDAGHQEAGQQMKGDIPREVLPVDRKAEREPRHGRKEQQPKRPKRRAEANRLAP